MNGAVLGAGAEKSFGYFLARTLRYREKMARKPAKAITVCNGVSMRRTLMYLSAITQLKKKVAKLLFTY